MESLDLRVLKDALKWRAGGHGVSLVTVVETWGSAPRPPGALLAMRDDGRISGSVSGGCVEDDLIVQSQRSEEPFAAHRRPRILTYGVSKDEATRFGIPCGGTLRLVHEPLSDVTWIEELLTRISRHELVERELTFCDGSVRLRPATRGQSLSFDGQVMRSLFGPRWRLLLIGAGQLSQAVAQIARMLDHEVHICDPRVEYADSLSLPGVITVSGMPDDAVTAIRPDAHTAIVALTHDPKLDDMALLEALRSEAYYVGALGSRRSQAQRKNRLAQHFGLSPEELARLHGPVGLAVGAKTPAEIAVSIMAELIHARRVITTDRLNVSVQAEAVCETLAHVN